MINNVHAHLQPTIWNVDFHILLNLLNLTTGKSSILPAVTINPFALLPSAWIQWALSHAPHGLLCHQTVPCKSTIGRAPPSRTRLLHLFSLPFPSLFFSTYSNLARHVSSVLFIIPQLLSFQSAANLLCLNLSPPHFYLELKGACITCTEQHCIKNVIYHLGQVEGNIYYTNYICTVFSGYSQESSSEESTLVCV